MTWIAIGKWWRACNSRAHAVDVSASCNNSLKTYLFRFTTHLAHFEETMIHIFLWKILSVPLSNSFAKSCCVIQIFVAILWVTIHVTLHSVGGKTTWRSMLCKWVSICSVAVVSSVVVRSSHLITNRMRFYFFQSKCVVNVSSACHFPTRGGMQCKIVRLSLSFPRSKFENFMGYSCFMGLSLMPFGTLRIVERLIFLLRF